MANNKMTKCLFVLGLTLYALILFCSPALAQGDEYDVLIRNGAVYDGLLEQPRPVDIGIRGPNIVAIGILSGVPAKLTIDASGLAVAPGFIDIHTHSDFNPLLNPGSLHKIYQGVTTEVVGNCGMSAAPVCGAHEDEMPRLWLREGVVIPEKIPWKTVREYFDALPRGRLVTNLAFLAGHGNIRSCVMGFEASRATPGQIQEMRKLLGEAMRDGAFGLSLGLTYLPGIFADEEELLALAEETEAQGGILSVHMRSEGKKLVESVQEVIRIAETNGVLVEISHLKAAGVRNWPKMNKVLKLIESAQSRGVAVFADAYPYEASFAELGVVLPEEIYRSPDRVKLLADKDKREELKKMVTKEFDKSGISLMNVKIAQTQHAEHKRYEGRRVAEAAQSEGKDPLDFLFDLLVEENFEVSAFSFSQDPEIVKRVIKKFYVSVGSDSIADFGPMPHPRAYGTFPRVIEKFVGSEEALSLGEAVRKMSFVPARVLGLRQRGTLAVGNFADLLIFDPKEVKSRADYEHPRRRARGMRYVFVNGTAVIADGRPTGAATGYVLVRERIGSAVTRA